MPYRIPSAAPTAALAVTVAVVLALAVLAPAPAPADEDERFPAVTHEQTKKECGACHMAFQPQMLPARSWRAIMGDLANHFGEDASLPQQTASEIEAYLVANAADARARGGEGRGMLRGVGPDQMPLRITELPAWVREHRGEVPASAWSRPDVGSKANCQACHRAAARGYYDDD